MLNDIHAQRVYLASAPMDLRKSIDGLAVIVQHCFNLDPFSPSLFVFCNKHRNKIKILEWSHCGFWLHYLRLEKGKFQWPVDSSSGTVQIDYRQLRWLLDGLSIAQQKAHSEVKSRVII
jgi:transposase